MAHWRRMSPREGPRKAMVGPRCPKARYSRFPWCVCLPYRQTQQKIDLWKAPSTKR